MPCVVAQMAAERGVDAGRAVQTVTLESAWDAAAVGDNGLAVGLWQFWPETWTWACALVGYPQWRDIENRNDPIKSTIVALEMIRRDWGHLWTGYRMTANQETGVIDGSLEENTASLD
jgi:hypothetical protein